MVSRISSMVVRDTGWWVRLSSMLTRSKGSSLMRGVSVFEIDFAALGGSFPDLVQAAGQTLADLLEQLRPRGPGLRQERFDAQPEHDQQLGAVSGCAGLVLQIGQHAPAQ